MGAQFDAKAPSVVVTVNVNMGTPLLHHITLRDKGVLQELRDLQ